MITLTILCSLFHTMIKGTYILNFKNVISWLFDFHITILDT